MISSSAAAARENARKADGKFGSYTLDEAGEIDLSWTADAPEEEPESKKYYGSIRAITSDKTFTEEARTSGAERMWGRINNTYRIATGITEVSCEGHGGVKLSPERNRLVHPDLRRAGGWYEEDCEYRIVQATFPEEFCGQNANVPEHYKSLTPEQVEAEALERVREYYPHEYEKATGEKVRPEDSSQVRRELFYEEHENDFVSTSAIMSEREGYVSIKARRASDGATQNFLLKREDYKARQAASPDGIYSAVMRGDDEIDLVANEKELSYERERQARIEENRAKARVDFVDTSKLTAKGRKTLTEWESKLCLYPDGEIRSNREQLERRGGFYAVEQHSDGKWYGLFQEEESVRATQIPAVLAKNSVVEDQTSDWTKQYLEDERARRKTRRPKW